MKNTLVKIILASLAMCFCGALLIDFDIFFSGIALTAMGWLGLFTAPALADMIDS